MEFEQAILQRHRELKVNLLHYVLGAKWLAVVTAPAIYSLIVPLALSGLFISFYQIVCFPVYGIPRVRRKEYLVFDRRYLAHLNILEKFNCAYCSYATGLIAYAREIASRTEQYWCPIKHARKLVAAHSRYGGFVDFGDATAYREELEAMRGKLRTGANR